MTPFFHVDQGVPAGCPQAPLLAKAVLAPALIPWKEHHPKAHLSSWVDDVGFDLAGITPLQVAQEAVEAYRDLQQRLTGLGLKVNPKKQLSSPPIAELNKLCKGCYKNTSHQFPR